jgi:hypothetical protein
MHPKIHGESGTKGKKVGTMGGMEREWVRVLRKRLIQVEDREF